ncbi:REP-associated tyrosine transposase [Algivirga pacifica]|uniref:Transposase n=1 Tax=Algivirga pacifica TaxID=1162670 RepID=A0ABP9DFW6_9BACT
MSRSYKIQNDENYYFVTFTVIQWIDVFSRAEYRNIFIDSIKYCQQNKGLLVGAWCIMSNHVHLIISSDGTYPLSGIIRDLKRHTSSTIRKAIESSKTESRKKWMLWIMKRAGTFNANNKDFQFWIQDNHPIQLTSIKFIQQRLRYIHYNPVKAGYVENPEDWIDSSAGDYMNKKGKIDITFLL